MEAPGVAASVQGGREKRRIHSLFPFACGFKSRFSLFTRGLFLHSPACNNDRLCRLLPFKAKSSGEKRDVGGIVRKQRGWFSGRIYTPRAAEQGHH